MYMSDKNTEYAKCRERSGYRTVPNVAFQGPWPVYGSGV